MVYLIFRCWCGAEHRPEANNRYLYNGKEKQLDLGNYYDYGARFYDQVIARWTNVDPLAEKYFGITLYAYADNLPVSLIDPNGEDIDDRALTDAKQKAGLIKFANTKEGTRYLNNYLKHGQSFSIKLNGKTYVFTNNGKSGAFANDILAFGSSQNLGENDTYIIVGLTRETKPADSDGNTLNLNSDGMGSEKDASYDVGKGLVIHQIWILDGVSSDEATSIIRHEAFVHDEPAQKNLLELRSELNNGKIHPGTAEYDRKLRLISNNGNADHQRLGNGMVTDYKNLAQQLDQMNNTTRFIKSYNDDVKSHGKGN